MKKFATEHHRARTKKGAEKTPRYTVLTSPTAPARTAMVSDAVAPTNRGAKRQYDGFDFALQIGEPRSMP
jgi:hypothetical protein